MAWPIPLKKGQFETQHGELSGKGKMACIEDPEELPCAYTSAQIFSCLYCVYCSP